jgi:uncharacterized protein (TIGR02646 family)
MRRVDRSKVPVPAILADEDEKGRQEYKKAIEFYSDEKNLNEPFKFSAYGDSTVKEALVKLFEGRCAYCECVVTVAYFGDIEHFRPKGEVVIIDKDGKRKTIKPGYYWLAADWNNLLLSCKHCNSPKEQTLPTGERKIQGKHNFFPLADDGKRLKKPTEDLNTEEALRLLINPCTDPDTENYFTFDEEGVIIPVAENTGLQKQKAQTSIDIYALQRVELVLARQAKVNDTKEVIGDIQDIIADINKDVFSPQEKAAKQERLKTKMKRLKAMLNSEYSAVVKQYANEFLRQYSNRQV